MQYKFDRFTLDAKNLSLMRDGQLLCIDQRMLKLMILLIEAYPASCEQQVLLSSIWQRTVVSYWSLARLVSDTRRFFRQNGCENPIIETVHGTGFRLSPLLLCRCLDVEDVQQPSEIKATPGSKPMFARMIGLGSMVFIAASTFIWLSATTPTTTTTVKTSGLTISEPADIYGRILWVDDNPDNNHDEILFLQQQNLAVYTVKNSSDALTLLKLYQYDAIISDMGREDDALAGLKLLQQVKAEYETIPFFFYTIMLSPTKRAFLTEQGADGAAEASTELYQQLLPFFSGSLLLAKEVD